MRMATKIFLGYIIVGVIMFIVNGTLLLLFINKQMDSWALALGISSAMIFFAGVFGIAYSRSITRDLNSLIGSARRISQGDLTEEAWLTKKGGSTLEIDYLIDSINTMLTNLRELTANAQGTAININRAAQNLSATAEQMNSSTDEVASTIEDISKGAELQAELVENTTKTVREIAGAIELTTQNAIVTSGSVSEAAQKAQGSGELANTAMEKMKQVFEKMANSQEMVVVFGSKTQKIGKIVEMITNIARQTNLLALNATIEAARAGEYGKGFAVVADEIRKLAESTSSSADQITDLIQEVSDESERVVSSMRETAADIAEGREDIGTINASLQEIVEMFADSLDKVRNIAELTQVQSEGAKTLVRSIDEIAKVAHDNASSTEEVSAATQEQTASMQEMASAARELNTLSDELKKVVSRFRLDSERPIEAEEEAARFMPEPADRVGAARKQEEPKQAAGEDEPDKVKENAKPRKKDSDDMEFIFE